MTVPLILLIGFTVITTFTAAYFIWRCYAAGYTQDAL